jgi:integrase/recombinase XerD
MPRPQLDPIPTTAAPTTKDMLRVWRADRCVQTSTAGVYLQWIRHFRAYCARHKLDKRTGLTLAGPHRFIAWYARQRDLDRRRLGGASTALYALSRIYHVMGLSLPEWQVRRAARPPATALLREYAHHLSRRCGNPSVTVRLKLAHVERLLAHLTEHGTTWRAMTLTNIDEFLIACANRYARSTVAGIASSIRSFARFLLVRGASQT